MPDSSSEKLYSIFGVIYRAPTLKRAIFQHRWARLQSAKRRAGEIGLPCRSYDDPMAWMASLSTGAKNEMLAPQGQQQHAPGVETLGDDGEPPESELAVTGVAQAEQQQEPSPPVTSAEPFPLLLDEPDVVDAGVPGVAVGREPSVTEELGDSGVLGLETQQQHEVEQQQQQSEPAAMETVATMGQGRCGLWRPAAECGP